MNICLVIIFVMLLVWNIVLYNEFPNVKVVSGIDGGSYTVKKGYSDVKKASNILAELNIINKTLIEHLTKKYTGTKYENDISYLGGNYNGNVLQEHTPRSKLNTSYVLNKGDVIKLCLRDPESGQFHDFNTLVFVNLHELSHLLDRGYGHSMNFWVGFKFILTTAVSLGLYDPVDYSKTPTSYCGIMITSSPYYNIYKTE
jgi:hypothetical protein